MKRIIPALLFTLLASCSPENITSNVDSSQPIVSSSTALSSPSQTATSSLITSSSSITTSNVTSTLVTSSSATTSTPTSSVVTSSSVVVSSSTSSATPSSSSTTSSTVTSTSTIPSSSATSSSAATAPLANIWMTAMGNINANDFYGVTETLPNTLSTVNVMIVHAVYRTNGTLYGYAYEALVDGNAGSKSIRFRVGIANNTFAAFVMVSHQEHGGFGVKIINALKNNLAGKTAHEDSIAEVLVAASATRSGISETYDGMIPALEAVVTHYLSKI